MGVEEVGHVAPAFNSSGSADLEWPAGTVAGHFAIAEADHSTRSSDDGPTPDGWAYVATKLWTKRLTATDIAVDLTLRGKLTSLLVVSGCGGVGRKSDQRRVYCDDDGGAGFFRAWTDAYNSDLASSTDRLGAEAVSPVDQHRHGIWLVEKPSAGYATVGDPGRTASFIGLELWPLVGPDAPTLVSPTAGAEIDRDEALPLAWLHNSTSGSAQEQVKVRIRAVSTGTWYYVTGAGSLTTTETTLTQSATTVTITAATLTADQAYEWQVSTADQGNWSDYSDTQTFTARARPTVDTITVTAPTTLTRKIAWTMTAGVGSQTAWQAAVTGPGAASVDGALWASPVTPGDALDVTVPATDADGRVRWTNGDDYLPWIRVQQDGGLWSEWTPDGGTFDVTWTGPDAPSSVTPANVTGGPLEVTVVGIPTGCGVQVQASTDSLVWADVVSLDSPSATQVVPVPKAPYGVAAVYRAASWELVDGVAIPSTWTVSASLASTDRGDYLVGDPDSTEYLRVQVVAGEQPRTLVQGVTKSRGMGATLARVIKTLPAGVEGSETIRTETAAELDAVATWVTTRDAWWLRLGPDHEDGVLVDAAPVRMTLAAQTGWARPVRTNTAARLITFDWTEQ